jgi:uncharacterized membrane protein YcaP (DUF421 family)
MFNLDLISAIGITARTLIIYLVILVGLRLSGKREIGQMTVFDLVVLLLISNAVQNAMVGPDTSLLGGILAAVVLLLVNATVARLRLTWPGLRRLVEGTPTLLVLHGEVILQHMRREGIDEEALLACASMVCPRLAGSRWRCLRLMARLAWYLWVELPRT